MFVTWFLGPSWWQSCDRSFGRPCNLGQLEQHLDNASITELKAREKAGETGGKAPKQLVKEGKRGRLWNHWMKSEKAWPQTDRKLRENSPRTAFFFFLNRGSLQRLCSF